MIYLLTNERNEKKKSAKRQNEKAVASEKEKRKRERESCNKNDSISYRLSVKLFANANGYIGIGKPIENLHFH